ncbi:Uncharacterized integral membrane protein [Actinopolyspora saharensis]|uniref:Uncharacterized integral membrane protein n=2 Tax=Actinopolyspora saharensis TaxID=995062 RepID=A0A1H1FUP6_9ACTN|nr:Uncharacterized integral membrane protein [Actinopolyspora saharensis]
MKPTGHNGHMSEKAPGWSDDGENGQHEPEVRPPGNGEGSVRGGEEARKGQSHTRTAGTWAAVVVATIALIILLIFILQNLQAVTVTFLGVRGELPLGVALLFAAAIGGLLVALVGAARIMQLRRSGKRKKRGKVS